MLADREHVCIVGTWSRRVTLLSSHGCKHILLPWSPCDFGTVSIMKVKMRRASHALKWTHNVGPDATMTPTGRIV